LRVGSIKASIEYSKAKEGVATKNKTREGITVQKISKNV
jgi:hypothetical protein